MQALNLTEVSVPLLVDVRNIMPEQLFYLQSDVIEQLAKGKDINLAKYLRFDDEPFIAGSLDHIRQQANRDEKEFGFAQLRLAVVFLRWHNLKESRDERIHSPLLLVPVELTKRKGVRDSFVLKSTSANAEVNPGTALSF